MFKFRKYVSFITHKDGLMNVIDTLSAYGIVKVRAAKDKKQYYVGLYCEQEALHNCLDSIMTMSEGGVWIRRLDIRFLE